MFIFSTPFLWSSKSNKGSNHRRSKELATRRRLTNLILLGFYDAMLFLCDLGINIASWET